MRNAELSLQTLGSLAFEYLVMTIPHRELHIANYSKCGSLRAWLFWRGYWRSQYASRIMAFLLRKIRHDSFF